MLIPFDYLFKKYDIQSKGVLHLGANEGQEAEAYRSCGVERVVWVEALPDVYKKLWEKVSKYENSTAILACLSDIDGQKVKFNIASNEAQSSSMLEFGTHSKEHPTVKFVDSIELTTTRLDTCFKDHGIEMIPDGWFLNIDLQGAELLALKGMGDLIQKFDHAYIEVNTRELYKGCPLAGEIDAFLHPYGFVPMETKMTGAGWGDRYYQRFPVFKKI